MRTLALWFPDWPVQAARYEDKAGAGPVVIASRYRVAVCDGAARAAGVRRGMRVRQAQALCPAASVVDADPERDARAFAGMVEDLAEVVPSIEILRPGMVVINAGAAGRFYGSEARAAEKIIDAAARAGIDCLAGIADEIPTAVIAARAQRVVEPGASRAFLAGQPVRVLGVEESLGCEPEVVDTLENLGLRLLGELAALPTTTVSTRFGRAGLRCHAIAAAEDDRLVAPAIDGEDLSVWVRPEDPITRVDEAAFLARALAARLHEALSRRGLVCQRLSVQAVTHSTTLERTWHTRAQLSERAMADRVRWQLDAWLAAGGGDVICELGLRPVECSVPTARSLWGADSSDEAQRVIARLQSTLGTDAVLTPVDVGGRGVSERIGMVAYGDSAEEKALAAKGSWPGRIPPPLPACMSGEAATLVGAGGEVYVTGEAVLSTEPATLRVGKESFEVTGWAGHWPVDDGWWRGKAPEARLQVVGVDGRGHPRAWLLVWTGAWRVEARFE